VAAATATAGVTYAREKGRSEREGMDGGGRVGVSESIAKCNAWDFIRLIGLFNRRFKHRKIVRVSVFSLKRIVSSARATNGQLFCVK